MFHGMKTILFLTLVLSAATLAHGEGLVHFANRVISPSGNLIAPVYGVNPLAPHLRLSGNANTNGGTVDYTGCAPLLGTNYIASLWAAPFEDSLVPADFQQLATTIFRAQSSSAGYWLSPTLTPRVPFVTEPDTTINLQVRVWDSRNGLIPTWAAALADSTVPIGYSDVFTYLCQPLPAPPQPTYNLQSFNLFVPIPEPSTYALGALGLLASLVAWRRRRE